MIDFAGVAQHYKQVANRKAYKNDPVLWAQERLNLFLWSKQQEILQALATHKKVAVKTSHSVGKTFSAAVAAAWWVDTRGPESIVISSAPTYAQVHALLWSEIRKFHVKGNLPGRVTQDDRWLLPYVVDGRAVDIEVGQGRKPADTNIHAFQGTHRSNGVLVILDEACGVSESIYTGAEAITTAPMDRQLLIGNPDDPNTEFGRIFKRKPDDWYLMTISAFDTPNFTGEWVPEYLRNSLPQPEWVESRRKDWGETSNRYISKIRAEFPDTSDDGLFNQNHVENAIRVVERAKSKHVAPVLGVDVARFGSDKTTVYANWNGHIEYIADWSGVDTVDTAAKVADIAEDIGAKEIRVDAIGVGAGVIDNLARMVGEHTVVYSMVGNAASPDPLKWYNARAYWYDQLRQKLSDEEIDLPDVDELAEEFGIIRYALRGSAMLIESKEDMRKRGLHSPDHLDAVVYACAPIGDDSRFSPGDIVTEKDLLNDDEFLYDVIEPWSFAPF